MTIQVKTAAAGAVGLRKGETERLHVRRDGVVVVMVDRISISLAPVQK